MAVEQIKTTVQNMDSETIISLPLPKNLELLINSPDQLPGKQIFFQKLKSKDYYFNPNYIIENSFSVSGKELKMNVSIFNADSIKKDLQEYLSSIKVQDIHFEYLAGIDDLEEKKIISNHIQTLIYPKYFKEDETSIFLNPDIDK